MKIRLVGLGLLALALAGCGGSKAVAALSPSQTAPGSSASTPSTVAAIDYGKQYLALVKPMNDAVDAFDKASKKDVTAADNHLIVGPTQAVADTVADFDSKVLRAQWPTSAQTDVRALVTVDATIIAACNRILVAVANNTASSADGQAFYEAAIKANAAANIVRADLGLPPPPSS